MGTHLVVDGPSSAFAGVVAAVGHSHRPVHAVTVSNAADAAAAVLAALAGADVVVHDRAPRDVSDQLCEDLRRLGGFRHIGPADAAPARRPVFAGADADHELLTYLGAGLTLRQAASRMYLSQRTAERRLSGIRARLGVRTTAEALRAWRDHVRS